MFEFIRTNGIIWSIYGVEGKKNSDGTPFHGVIKFKWGSFDTAEKNTLINISKIAKSWRNTSVSEDIAPQSRGILQTIVWCGARTPSLPPPPFNHTNANVCKIPWICIAISSLVSIKSLSNLATFFLQKLKKPWKDLFTSVKGREDLIIQVDQSNYKLKSNKYSIFLQCC